MKLDEKGVCRSYDKLRKHCYSWLEDLSMHRSYLVQITESPCFNIEDSLETIGHEGIINDIDTVFSSIENLINDIQNQKDFIEEVERSKSNHHE